VTDELSWNSLAGKMAGYYERVLAAR
jgi:hypothetical protein